MKFNMKYIPGRSVAYVFTLNNPTREEILYFRDILMKLRLGYADALIYIGYGFEGFFDQGRTPHLQGLIISKLPMSIRQLKNAYCHFKRVHFEEVETTVKEAREYCKKELFFEEAMARLECPHLAYLTDHFISYKIAKKAFKLEQARKLIADEEARVKAAREESVLQSSIADDDSCPGCGMSDADQEELESLLEYHLREEDD